jgi:hypothetical protein
MDTLTVLILRLGKRNVSVGVHGMLKLVGKAPEVVRDIARGAHRETTN